METLRSMPDPRSSGRAPYVGRPMPRLEDLRADMMPSLPATAASVWAAIRAAPRRAA